jgi:hypothetical protein
MAEGLWVELPPDLALQDARRAAADATLDNPRRQNPVLDMTGRTRAGDDFPSVPGNDTSVDKVWRQLKTVKECSGTGP